jgi:H+/Cl- antiporter ClcA
VLGASPALGRAWLAAPVIGILGGLFGGLFSRILGDVMGPAAAGHPIGRLRRARPVLFAAACGVAAAAFAIISGGWTFGAGYAEAQSLLTDHPGRGLGFALCKFGASLAAAVAGLPGGIFAPSLATGAGLGAAMARIGLGVASRDAVVLGMTAYLSGVVQAPLTSAVILMEMTRDPGLVGPLMLAALLGRWASGLICREPIYHLLARNWRLDPAPGGAGGRH